MTLVHSDIVLKCSIIILFAGVTEDLLPTAAISASPYVPRLENIRVMFSAYDAINYTEINSTTIIKNSEFAFNRGKLHVVYFCKTSLWESLWCVLRLQ